MNVLIPATFQRIFVDIGVVLTFATVVLTFFQTLKSKAETKDNGHKIDEVHVLVNSQLTAVLARVIQLTKVLNEEGVRVPDPPEVIMPPEAVKLLLEKTDELR